MQASFDTWTSSFLFAVAMGFFLFLVLLSTRNKRNYPIAFFVLAFSLILFQYVLFWTKYQKTYPYFMLLPTLCYVLTGPLLYLYFLNLYHKKVRYHYTLHFFPAFLFLVSNIVIWLKYLKITSIKVPFIFKNDYFIIIIHMLLYIGLIIHLIQKNKNIKTEFQKIRHQWAKVLIVLYSLFVFSYISYYVLVNFSFFNSQWDYIISFMMSISIYVIGYFVFKAPKIFDGEFFTHLFLSIKNKKETIEDSLLNEFYENLKQYIEKEKPFIDNELRLVHLADKVGYSTHLLSKIINEKSGKNFNQFINDYRLNEAEKLLNSKENLNIKSIYFDVGFNNKVTFYKAFKKKYYCTPKEFQDKSCKIL